MFESNTNLVKNNWYDFENSEINYHYKNNDSNSLHIYFNG